MVDKQVLSENFNTDSGGFQVCIWAGMTTEEITDQGVRYKDLKDNQIEESGWGKRIRTSEER